MARGSRLELLGRGCLFYSPTSFRLPHPGRPSSSLAVSCPSPLPHCLICAFFSRNRKVGSRWGATLFIPIFPPLITSLHPRRSSQAWGGAPGGCGGDSISPPPHPPGLGGAGSPDNQRDRNISCSPSSPLPSCPLPHFSLPPSPQPPSPSAPPSLLLPVLNEFLNSSQTRSCWCIQGQGVERGAHT